MDPGDYLGKLYSSRALFKLLVTEATSVLPPLTPGDQKRWSLESIRSQRDLARLLSVSPSTVAIDLVRLHNFGWIQKERSKRVLGARQGSHLFLMADAAAEAATGVAGLVGREVLGIAPAVQDAEAEATEFNCGPSREWKPDGT